MKKIKIVLTSLLIALFIVIPSSAANVSLGASASKTTVVPGENIEIVVSVTNAVTAKKGVVVPTLSSNLEFVSGTFLQSATIAKFDGNHNGAIMYASEQSAAGQLCKIVVKAKSASKVTESVSVRVEFFDETGAPIGSSNVNKNIKVVCATHTYGAYTKVDDNSHRRECSTCGNVETTNHNWNGGTTTKEASCKETGNKKYTCTTCQAEKNETIAKTNNHKYGSWSVTKKATCTTAGTESRTCSVCSKVDTRNISALGHSFSNPTVTKQPTCTDTGTESGKCTRCGQSTTNTIKAKGHKFGAWTETKAATCTENGIQERKCSVCQTKENRNTDALAHDFENPVLVKEATISTTGLMEGKCKRCGEATSEVIPCSAKDETTGILFETAEGVFAEGTQMQVVEIAEGDALYENIKNALSDVTEKFVVFDVNALLNDAKVQPNGKVKVTFNVPEGFGKNIAVYFVSDNGEIELIESVVSEDGKTVTAELSHFSSYAIADLDSVEDKKEENTDPDITTNEKDESNSDATTWIIISGAVVIAIAGTVATIVFMKKKKNITE